MGKNIIIGLLVILVIGGGGFGTYQTMNLKNTNENLSKADSEIKSKSEILKDTQLKLQIADETLNKTQFELKSRLEELQGIQTKLNEADNKLKDEGSRLLDAKNKLEDTINNLKDKESNLQKTKSDLIEIVKQLEGTKETLQVTQTDLNKTHTTLNNVMNNIKSEVLPKEIPLIPDRIVVEKAANAEAMATMLARSTYTVTYSLGDLGEKKARRGKIVMLGKQGDKYVGFTTLCAVSLKRPYPDEDESQQNRPNELIILGDKNTGYDWYKVKGCTILSDSSIGATYFDSSLAGGGIVHEVEIDADKYYQSGLKDKVRVVRKGEKIKIEASGKWFVSNSSGIIFTSRDEYECGPEGTKIGGPNNAPFGALMAYILDNDSKILDKFVVTERSEFIAPNAGQLYFAPNCYDKDFKYNHGKLSVKIWGEANPVSYQLKNLEGASNEVEIKPVGEHDIALVYFPINKDNFFGGNLIYSLGLDNPTEQAVEAVKKSEVLFGIKFVHYCEHCHAEIQRVPEKLREMYEKGYQAGYKEGFEKGKQEGKKELVGSFIRAGLNFINTLTGGLIQAFIPTAFQDVAAAIAQNVVLSFVNKQWEGGKLKATIEKEVPLLKDTLPESLFDLFPADISPKEISKNPDKFQQLAGIEFDDTSGAKEYLNNLLEKAEEIVWVPSSETKGSQEGNLLVNGQFVNQLLVSLGMAKVTTEKKKAEKLPFYKEMKQSEKKAKDNKIGIWAK